MIAVRVGLFLTTLLGFMYAVLSINGDLGDVTAGMVVALAGIIGWAVMSWLEERR